MSYTLFLTFQALALEGKQTSLVAEYIMKVCFQLFVYLLLIVPKNCFCCVCPVTFSSGLINLRDFLSLIVHNSVHSPFQMFIAFIYGGVIILPFLNCLNSC